MLTVKGLTKVYKPKKGPSVLALDNVDLDFQEKALVFLLGKSGSGKSTLLNLLGGLDSYTSGELIIKGKSSKDFKGSDFDSYRNTFIGFVFQEFYILEEYSVAKNIAIALELQGKKADKETVDKILEEVDLDGYGDRKPNELSGGQKQRVAIARALIKEPEIILADEPTGSLDSNTGRQIFETLKKLSKDKLVIVVSHDRENAEKYADRIIELKDGKVLDDVSLTESADKAESNVVFLEDSIFIKAGHELTAEDMGAINTRLKKSGTGAYISLDDTKNREFAKKLPHKSSAGQRYIQTDAESLKLKQYSSSDFKLVKSRFPFKDSLKMGASGLKFKRIRLAFTIILSFIAFTMFGLADTMAAFDEVNTNISTIYENNIKVAVVNKQTGVKFSGEYMWYESGYTLDAADSQWINSHFSAAYPVFTGYYDVLSNFKDHPYNAAYSDGNFSYQSVNSFLTSIKGFVVLDTTSEQTAKKDMQNLGLELIAGTLPSEKEVLITEPLAAAFVQYNYVEEYRYAYVDEEYWDGTREAIKPATINSYQDLIGKKLLKTQIGNDWDNPDNNGVIIAGIVSTDVSPEMYAESQSKPMSNGGWGMESIAFIGKNNGLNVETEEAANMLVKLPNSRTELTRIFNAAAENTRNTDQEYGTKERLWFSTIYSGAIETYSTLAIVLKSVFLYASIIFCAFSFLLFINFIGTSIANKRKEIGILRAIGARSVDVYGIFFNESMIIALINLTLAITATLLGAFAFNKLLGIAIMVVGVRQIAFMILLAVGVAALGTLIPVYRFVKKKPIETINDR